MRTPSEPPEKDRWVHQRCDREPPYVPVNVLDDAKEIHVAGHLHGGGVDKQNLPSTRGNLQQGVGSRRDGDATPPNNPAEDWPTLAVLERRYIDLVLARTGGNKTRAAKVLGIDRRTLNRMFARERARAAATSEKPS
jgi:DNA-binding NtrC family response regulator